MAKGKIRMKSTHRQCDNKKCKYKAIFIDQPPKLKCRRCKKGNMIITHEEKKKK